MKEIIKNSMDRQWDGYVQRLNEATGVISLTSEARRNYSVIQKELTRRKQIGLIGEKLDNPDDQIIDYLNRLSTVDPKIDQLTNSLVGDKNWKQPPELVITIPIVGTGNQEIEVVRNTVDNLNSDPTVRTGKIGIIFLVNRPENSPPDKTFDITKDLISRYSLNAIALNLDVPSDLGYITGPFSDEMATLPNQVPIGLLRDILSISTMKLWAANQNYLNPPILQMDGDFEGINQGSFQTIIDRFKDPALQFLQCSSDWDSQTIPTASIPEMSLGANLMRELPQIIKKPLNDPQLPSSTRVQIIFGEAIQRGIQVPQAERMSSIAVKGGFGLCRLREDELDQNIRTSEMSSPGGVQTAADIIFVWSNRRAVQSWLDNGQPPISQWVNEFSVTDPVREISLRTNLDSPENSLGVINKTLARLPLPRVLPGVYQDFQQPVKEVVSRYRQGLNYTAQTGQNGDLYYLQASDL